MNISVSPELEKLIKEKMKTGQYVSPEEVIKDALNLLPTNKENGAGRAHDAKAKAKPSYRDVEDLLIDEETLAHYARHADDNVTLEQVQEALSKMPGSLAETIIEERG